MSREQACFILGQISGYLSARGRIAAEDDFTGTILDQVNRVARWLEAQNVEGWNPPAEWEREAKG